MFVLAMTGTCSGTNDSQTAAMTASPSTLLRIAASETPSHAVPHLERLATFHLPAVVQQTHPLVQGALPEDLMQQQHAEESSSPLTPVQLVIPLEESLNPVSLEEEVIEVSTLSPSLHEIQAIITDLPLDGTNVTNITLNNEKQVTQTNKSINDINTLMAKMVHDASSFGMDKMNQLFDITEPRLFKIGLQLSGDSPGSYVAAFNAQSDSARNLARYGYAALQASASLMARQREREGHEHSRLEGQSPDAELLRECPMRHNVMCPQSWQRYRSADGRCNHRRLLTLGTPLTPYKRLLPATYQDDLEQIRRSVTDNHLPSARTVSTALLRASGRVEWEGGHSHVSQMLMQWGQFIDHDLTSTPQSHGFNGSVPQCCLPDASHALPPEILHPECLPIRVSWRDPFYGPLGVKCLHFVRSAPAPRVDCMLGARQQANAVTAFHDGSQVYGSNEVQQFGLRLFRYGLLNFMKGGSSRQKPLLPAASPPGSAQPLCRTPISTHQPCLVSGDFRVNEQPALTSMHVLWLREHNRVANILRGLNPGWHDERLFQETRRIVVATMQRITLHEFLPLVLGPDVMKVFELTGVHPGFDEEVDPSAPNAFAAAAFRFGHGLVQDKFWRCDSSHRPLPFNVSLHEELAQPGLILGPKMAEQLLLGLCRQRAPSRTEHRVTRELTDRLFEHPGSGPGLDLAALNVQRGRDHGLAPYNSWRKPCGLKRFHSWQQLLRSMTPNTVHLLQQLYRHVDDIDLFVGGMAELPVDGGLVGPTFACIIGQHFMDLRIGDRFWYEVQDQPSSFTPTQLVHLQQASLARVLCDNLEDVTTIPRWPLRASSAPGNDYLSCTMNEAIPAVNFGPWRENKSTGTFRSPSPQAETQERSRSSSSSITSLKTDAAELPQPIIKRRHA